MNYNLIPNVFKAVTPSDTTNVAGNIGLYVGAAGNVVVKDVDGNTSTFIAQAGQYLVGNFAYVMAASTATGIVALYAR